MGAEIFGGEVTVTSTAQNLSTLLGLGEKKFLSTLVIRADTANTADIFYGKGNVTTSANRLGFLQAGEALTVDIHSFTNTDELYLIAASDQNLFVTGVV